VLDYQVRASDRQMFEASSAGCFAALAPGRDGLLDRWQEDVLLAGGRAVDHEGEVLDLVVQRRRTTDAALRLLKRLLHDRPVEPQTITTDGLA